MCSYFPPGNLPKRLFSALVWAITFGSASGQNIAANQHLFSEDLLLTEVNPLHAFGIFTFNTPFYFGSFKTREHKFTAGYSFGNTWHPPATIYYPQNMTARQVAEVNSLYVTDRPAYFEKEGIHTLRKMFSTDGVLQNMSFTYLLPLAQKGSFIFKLNTFILSGGKFPLHYPASDAFIEKIHTLAGLDDNFGRKLFPFNQALIFYQDQDGNQIKIEKGQVFMGTFDVNYFKPIWQFESRTSFLGLQGGAHLNIPFNKYYPRISGGLSAAMLYRQKIFPRFYTDLGVDCAISHYSLANLGNAPDLIDRNLRISSKSYISFNFVSQANHTFCFGLLCNFQESFLKGNIFNYTQDHYRNLGISYLKAADTWEGTVVNKTPRLSKLTAASMYYFSLKPYFFWGFKGKKSEFIFTICEDYPLVNNAPDIQYGFSLTRKLNW